MKIDAKEVSAIAKIARIAVTHEEVDQLGNQLESVLSYAQQVVNFVQNYKPKYEQKNDFSNVLREDKVINSNVESIFSQAPAIEENYFIVPKILETTK